MPEGPEVKTVARTLSQHLVGKELGTLWHSSLKLRRLVDYQSLKKLKGAVIDSVDCYGKVLFIGADKKPVIFAQLGMTGQLKVEDKKASLAPHTHIRWQLKDSHQELRYVDPRRFGLVDICSTEIKRHIINRLGPDPFTMDKAKSKELALSINKSSRAIKDALLDQSLVVGVGNIYASEALFLASINPKMRACDLSVKQCQALVSAIIKVLHLAYDNCGTSFSNYVDGSGKKGSNLEFLQVFMRNDQPCFGCGRAILRIKQSGRSTFYCPSCQK